MAAQDGGLEGVLANNKKWAAGVKAKHPDFFNKLANTQSPKYLWIGCADSRVPANVIMGLAPGEVFVQRNVGNVASQKDLNVGACLEYSVDHLKVKHILVCGHYNCGCMKASLLWKNATPGIVNLWISEVRAVRDMHAAELKKLSGDAQVARLAELNVIQQVFNMATSNIVQAAWERGQPLAVHGIVYSPADGILKELTPPITSMASLNDLASAKGFPLLEGLSARLKAHVNFPTECASANCGH